MSCPPDQIGATFRGNRWKKYQKLFISIFSPATQRLERGNQSLRRLQGDLVDNFRDIALSILSVGAGQSG
jgi:hypothetical protein